MTQPLRDDFADDKLLVRRVATTKRTLEDSAASAAAFGKFRVDRRATAEYSLPKSVVVTFFDIWSNDFVLAEQVATVFFAAEDLVIRPIRSNGQNAPKRLTALYLATGDGRRTCCVVLQRDTATA